MKMHNIIGTMREGPPPTLVNLQRNNCKIKVLQNFMIFHGCQIKGVYCIYWGFFGRQSFAFNFLSSFKMFVGVGSLSMSFVNVCIMP